MRVCGEHVGALEVQGGGNLTPSGVDSGQQPGPYPGYHGVDVEHDGQGEPKGSHLMSVYEHADGWLLGGGDLMLNQVHQLRASGRGQGAPGSVGKIMMRPPARHEQAKQVGVQQRGGVGGGLVDGGLTSRLRQVLQGTLKVRVRGQDLLGQCFGGACAGAE